MRRTGLIAGTLVALLAPAASAHAAAYVPGEVLVRFDGRATVREAAIDQVAGRVRDLDVRAVPGLELVKLPAGDSVPAAVRELEAQPGVAEAGPNYIVHEEESLPSEPRFGQLWAARNTGQIVNGTGGIPDADIDLADAWDVTRGSPGVVIAVMDGGLDYTNPDLGPNLWTNPADPVNGVDDDANGLVDDTYGWDFADNDSDPRDFRFHGTHTAGIIGAIGNNGFATAGINWNAKLMPLRVTNAYGSGTSAAIVQAMDYAGRHGVRVLNGSLGANSGTIPVGYAETVAAYPNTLYVFAAGNANSNNDALPHFPSGTPGDNVIAVGSSTQSDTKSSFSNYGATTVDLVAPGSNTLSTGIARQERINADFQTAATPPAAQADGFTTAGLPAWGVTSERSSDGPGAGFSFADSPGVNYANNTHTSITSPAFNLSGLNGCRLFFRADVLTAAGDTLTPQVSTDGSTFTTLLPALSGDSPGFTTEQRALPSSAVAVRFAFDSDGSIVGNGVWVDDVIVRCFTPGVYEPPFTADGASFSSGTSFSAPQVSGVAGLLLAKNPAVSTAQLRAAILGGVDPKPAFAGITVTGGRLNALNALNLTPAPPAPPAPPPPAPDRTRPAISYMVASPFGFQPAYRGASLSRVIVIRPRRLPRFTTVSIRLSEAATVAFRVERLLPGRRVGRSCLLATRARRFRPRCTRAVLLPGTFRTALRAGLNRKRFNGRLLNRKLPVGSYRLVATATDAARNVSLQRRAGFRTLAAPRVRIIRR
ncbi:MAG: S8 family serine peptidase [Solirubrobacteraceae bacterium]